MATDSKAVASPGANSCTASLANLVGAADLLGATGLAMSALSSPNTDHGLAKRPLAVAPAAALPPTISSTTDATPALGVAASTSVAESAAASASFTAVPAPPLRADLPAQPQAFYLIPANIYNPLTGLQQLPLALPVSSNRRLPMSSAASVPDNLVSAPELTVEPAMIQAQADEPSTPACHHAADSQLTVAAPGNDIKQSTEAAPQAPLSAKSSKVEAVATGAVNTSDIPSASSLPAASGKAVTDRLSPVSSQPDADGLPQIMAAKTSLPPPVQGLAICSSEPEAAANVEPSSNSMPELQAPDPRSACTDHTVMIDSGHTDASNAESSDAVPSCRAAINVEMCLTGTTLEEADLFSPEIPAVAEDAVNPWMQRLLETLSLGEDKVSDTRIPFIGSGICFWACMQYSLAQQPCHL